MGGLGTPEDEATLVALEPFIIGYPEAPIDEGMAVESDIEEAKCLAILNQAFEDACSRVANIGDPDNASDYHSAASEAGDGAATPSEHSALQTQESIE